MGLKSVRAVAAIVIENARIKDTAPISDRKRTFFSILGSKTIDLNRFASYVVMARRVFRSRERRGINPTFIFFLIGLVLFFVGLVLPPWRALVIIGGFIVLTYLVTVIVWICSREI